jgi:beta-galactosidase
MNHFLRIVNINAAFLIVLGLFSFRSIEAQDIHRQRLLMDSHWTFQLGDQKDADKVSYDDSRWRELNLPHDWSIEGQYDKDAPTGGSGGYLPTGIGWYRRHFQVSNADLNKTVWIEFDGVYMNSDVWLNGHHLGKYPYGYSSFSYELTSFLQSGENVIAVRVDNSLQPNTRWYSGSGIYRHVWFVKVNPLHIGKWGIAVTTPYISTESATVEVKTRIENDYKVLKKGMLQTVLTNSEGTELARVQNSFSVKAGMHSELRQQLTVKSPQLWSVETPALYQLRSMVVDGEQLVDEEITTVGIRKIEYDVDKGFLLNGKHVKMNGVCLHHDGGCVGAAVPSSVWERRLTKLKEMGCNAIRTSHNPPAPEFLDLCDKMGFLVMDEPFDEWRIGKRKYGYHDYFDKWAHNDLKAMIHRDRNHPSIVLWSAGNEIPEQKTKDGADILRLLVETYHHEDPTRPVTLACDNIAADGGSTTLAFLKGLDIVGYNYVDRWHERRELFYSLDRQAHPDWKMIGTESVSNSGGIRGEYSLGGDSSVIRANYNYGMIDAEQLWKFVDTRDYVIGDFMWTGIDYLGEASWPDKNDSFGVLDLCGFPKDGYYFYQSRWTQKPMVHLFPHWNWRGREGQAIPVLCYTNCNAVELFLNGKSFGEKRMEFPRQGNSGGWNSYDKPRVYPTTADLHLEWDIPYEPGILKAVGRKDGKIVCVEEIRTTGAAASLKMVVDRDTVIADARDAANVEVTVVDNNGNVVPTADNLVQFSITGEGIIAGVDNGNPRDHDPYKSDHRKAFNGLCLAVIQSSDKAGRITLIAKSEGLKDASIEIIVQKDNPIKSLP